MNYSNPRNLKLHATSKPFLMVVSAIFGAICASLVSYFSEPHYKEYRYSDERLEAEIINILEKKSIPYRYEIDHLKRRWITPYVHDDRIMLQLEAETRKADQTNKPPTT